ncbi:hypothetical protein EC973_007564 [Apophysomyces ossiformis]|uniref:Uncharacterized protein n=1 Tax=Apophysomyces ossiformis TaxID=679940 RepID=A0A8H7BP20_9FUNG|nr:hypothetical protein EC973_007564 [Apophysomyces ossiformis]
MCLTCWTVLPDLASVGYDGIKHDVNATVRRDSSRRVMLKVRLEDLMQLLLRDDRPLNWDVPWSGRPWRQKTGYGFVQLTMAGPDLFGSIDIDPVPYNNPNRGLTLTGNAIQELWENGYTGFPNDLFSGTNGPDECLTLRFKLEHHKIGTTATYALTPLAFGWILHRICILFGSSDEAKVCTNHTCRNSWNELTNETGMLAARLNWTSGGNRSAVKTVQGLAELAVKMRKAHFKRLR